MASRTACTLLLCTLVCINGFTMSHSQLSSRGLSKQPAAFRSARIIASDAGEAASDEAAAPEEELAPPVEVFEKAPTTAAAQGTSMSGAKPWIIFGVMTGFFFVGKLFNGPDAIF